MNEPSFDLYRGDGMRRLRGAPPFRPVGEMRDPQGYEASPGLRDAVNVALSLGMPLFLTGDPGTGKTELAHNLAWEMGLPEPLVFNAKTTSTAQDLFYRYDALRHFHASRFDATPVPIREFIDFEPLGKALILTMPREQADALLSGDQRWRGLAPIRTVVLIDEIDKAPRDLPNDILNEIDEMAFTIKETGERFPPGGGRGDSAFRPIIVMTSNSEKNLPDAFLRRCVYYNIPFPESVEELEKIVRKRLHLGDHFSADRVNQALTLFSEVRKLELTRKPATGEMLSWMRTLNDNPRLLDQLHAGRKGAIASTYSLLVKNREDSAILKSAFGIADQR
ncbi:MAG TPA: MoxR family ATPase [Thermoanaerobaculia bacterium]|nr:MoxR family ATPase [Thermoanaerobaculia bacterium]